MMKQHKKTEIVLREDNTIFGEYDYIDIIQLKIDIVNGKIKEKLYFRNEHGGKDEIDKYGYSYYNDFSQINELLREFIQAQIKKRIKNEGK